MARALAAGQPVQITVSSIATTLGAPYVSERTLDHVKALVEDVLVVSDADAVRGVMVMAEDAKLWVQPAAGCLVPAVWMVIDRMGANAVIGLVLCGGNVSFADVSDWAGRFGIASTSADRSRAG